MKKAISIFISAIMLITVVIPSFSALADTVCDCAYTPIIYIKGRTNIYKDKNNEDSGLAERNISGDGAVGEAAVNITSALAKAVLTDDWGNYCDVMFDEISPVYDSYALNCDGEIDNESGISRYWTADSIISRVYAYGRNYHIDQKDDITLYQFQYDCRLDPCDTAADLNRMIKAVKEVSGHDKVKIVARCQGTVIANAYFNIFGWDDIEEVLLYNSISSGAEIADSVFSGNVVFDSESWNRFLFEFLDTSPVLDFIKASVGIAARNGALKSTTGLVQKIYDKIESNLMPRIIKATFGQCPGWYGMISTEKYEACKNYVLGDNADGKYDKLIGKIDNYNYNYKTCARSILEEMREDGVNIYIVAKYNNQMYPVVENCEKLGDNVVSVWAQTFKGATCADITKTLDEEYLSKANEKYISPDKMVDSSTGLFPEHTWYLKNLQHDYYPLSFDPYMLMLLRYDGYADINTFEDMPQWLLFVGTTDDDDNNIEPLTEDNINNDDYLPQMSFIRVLANFFKKFRTLIIYVLNSIEIK